MEKTHWKEIALQHAAASLVDELIFYSSCPLPSLPQHFLVRIMCRCMYGLTEIYAVYTLTEILFSQTNYN